MGFKVAIIILTYNEEPHIVELIESLLPYNIDIFIVDNSSTDKTVDIAGSYDVNIMITKPMCPHEARNYIVERINKDFNYEWFLHIDADEIFDKNIFIDLQRVLKYYTKKSKPLVFKFPRINMPDKKNFPDYQVRILKNDSRLYWDRYPDEKVFIDGKQADKINCIVLNRYPIIHLERRTDIKREWW